MGRGRSEIVQSTAIDPAGELETSARNSEGTKTEAVVRSIRKVVEIEWWFVVLTNDLRNKQIKNDPNNTKFYNSRMHLKLIPIPLFIKIKAEIAMTSFSPKSPKSTESVDWPPQLADLWWHIINKFYWKIYDNQY